ncbi:hypothetical protein GETHLI_34700 [Geothrix limicola]|uniref:IPT/TIG domain-containing protein n=1 Tax=Geothrix limicola TaxID=2927978 RepID=A0ABQ5QLC1_9BACT|nr:IPT/TIG domain-containing protein [Geothrix limicola]GLH74968.1 hypothetical protein GETHLI_34700 [Geothrix limicola]
MTFPSTRCLALTGLVLLGACGGGGGSSAPAPAVALAPTISAFSPMAIAEESTVTLTGAHFLGATQVAFNQISTSFTVSSDTQIQAIAPAGLTAGTITVTTPGGTGTSATAYTVAYWAPTITSVSPSSGQVGMPVVITGTNFGYAGTTLALGAQNITGFTKTATQISFDVPSGAVTGNLVVAGPGGTASSPFTVTPPPAGVTLDLHVDKVELTQSTQTLDNSVPIVAGKPGLIRAFVLANQANTATPAVRITLLNNGVAVGGYPKLVAAPGLSVPQAVDESTLTSSWNLSVPGTDLTTPTGSGYSILAEVDPTGAVPEIDKTNNTFTATLNGTTVPTFKTTIFPVVLGSGTGNITEANKAQWVARLAKMFPISSVDVAVGSTFTGSVSTLTSDNSDKSWDTLLSDLTAKHLADQANDRYYYGAVKVSYSNGTAGLGWVPNSPGDAYKYRTAVGWDKASGYADGGLFPEVFSHETGHNMGRQHSPCGTASNPDPNYPNTSEYVINGIGGGIGKWGYDSVLNALHSPLTNKDIMGYCTPNWVSDYVYKSILSFRAGSSGFLVVSAEDAILPTAPARQECLIVRGIIHENGQADLLPSFRTEAWPSTLPIAGDFTLECQDAQGRAVFTTPLELMDLGCSPQDHVRHFVMALPLDPAKLDAIAGLRVLRAGQVVTSLHPASPKGSITAATPSAQRQAGGKVQLAWDASLHPAALVRDADSGEVIAILSGGRQTITATSRRLDVVLSDGVSGPTHHLEPLE